MLIATTTRLQVCAVLLFKRRNGNDGMKIPPFPLIGRVDEAV